jgi:hypothetical protein
VQTWSKTLVGALGVLFSPFASSDYIENSPDHVQTLLSYNATATWRADIKGNVSS